MNSWFRPKKTVLLLGAGFTKDFGGYLSKEMWSLLFWQPEIQERPELRGFMNEVEYNYETVYDLIIKDSQFTAEQKLAFQQALNNAYRELDESICGTNSAQTARATSACRIILTRFTGAGRERGFIFSLNQDLFIERYFAAEGNFLIKIPGIHRNSWFRGNWVSPLQPPDEVQLPGPDLVKKTQDSFAEKSTERLVFLKLHGSYGWKSADGSDLLVVGHAKTETIAKEPLLNWYLELFRQVLNDGNRMLVVVGYGFGDEHINTVIAEAVNNSGLTLNVVTPKSAAEFKEEIDPLHGTSLPKPRANDILKAFVHTPHKITDFYLPGQSRPTPQGEQFLKSAGLL